MNYDVIVAMRQHGVIKTRTRIEEWVDLWRVSFHHPRITLRTFLYGNLPLGWGKVEHSGLA